jgi:hypothetical protein
MVEADGFVVAIFFFVGDVGGDCIVVVFVVLPLFFVVLFLEMQ